MQTKEFLTKVEETIKNWASDHLCIELSESEIIQVWYCKTIQNHKGLFIIRDISRDCIAPYFIEVTYNGDREEMYLDYYCKYDKQVVFDV